MEDLEDGEVWVVALADREAEVVWAAKATKVAPEALNCTTKGISYKVDFCVA